MADITFLGTGGDAYTIGRQIRGAGGVIVKLADNQIHIDPGPGALPAAKKADINLRHTVALLVSNADLHHAGDVDAVLSAMSYGGLDPHGVVLAADSVINGTDELSAKLSLEVVPFAERTISLEGVPRVGINDVTIEVLAAHNSDPTAAGFGLIGAKEIISYTGATGLTDEVKDAHKGSTALIACMSLPPDLESEFELNASDVIELCNFVKPKTLIITGFGQQLLKSDVRAVGRDIAAAVKAHVVVAEDGLHIDSGSYR